MIRRLPGILEVSRAPAISEVSRDIRAFQGSWMSLRNIGVSSGPGKVSPSSAAFNSLGNFATSIILAVFEYSQVLGTLKENFSLRKILDTLGIFRAC